MKVKVLETFGYFEPGPDEKTSGPFREYNAGQVVTDVADEQAKAWIDKGHVEDADKPAAAPIPPPPLEPPADHTAT